jgi:hypothetical protein
MAYFDNEKIHNFVIFTSSRIENGVVITGTQYFSQRI